MIKIKTKYDYDTDTFKVDFKHKDSCTNEFVALICLLIDEIYANDKEMTEKELFKFIKEFKMNNVEEI